MDHLNTPFQTVLDSEKILLRKMKLIDTNRLQTIIREDFSDAEPARTSLTVS